MACYAITMSKAIACNVTLSEKVVELVKVQVAHGRYKDFSAGVQDAAYHYFSGEPSIFSDYGVTPEEVDHSAQIDLAKIRKLIKSGKAKAWKPGK